MARVPEYAISKGEADELNNAIQAAWSEWFPDTVFEIPPKYMALIALATALGAIVKPRMESIAMRKMAAAKPPQRTQEAAPPSRPSPQQDEQIYVSVSDDENLFGPLN
jgi:hypothetical protein